MNAFLLLLSIGLCCFSLWHVRSNLRRSYDRGWLAGVEYQTRISNRKGGSSK